MMFDWPMVGRGQELARVEGQLHQHSSGVVLAGLTGVGKTRLAIECLGLAAKAGFTTLRVAATPFTASVPFGALAAVLPSAESQPSAVSRTRGELLHHYARGLVNHAGGNRLALLVDDAHHLDTLSAALVHQLATSGSTFVLATVRTGEPTPIPITALWKDGVLERLELETIPVVAVEKLLTRVLNGPVDRATVTKLATRSTGNLLFLRELVQGAHQDGSLRQDGGMWQLLGPLNPSQRLIELVTERVGSLDSAERELLEIVALGEPVGPAEMNVAAEPSLADVLEQKHLITSRLNSSRMEVRLAHPLYGDVIRSQIPPQRRRKLACALAEAVESTGARRREDVLRVATLRLEGGGGDPELMLAAATMARWRFAYPLAQRLVQAALAAGADFDAELLSAQLEALQGFGTAAEIKLKELTKRATTDRERGLIAVNRLDGAVFQRGQLDDSLSIIEEAEASISDPAWRDELSARRSGILLGTRGMTACVEAVRPLLGRASGRALAWAAFSGAYSLARAGNLAEARDAAEKGHAAHLALDSPLEWDPSLHVSLHCDALAYAGQFELADKLASDLYEGAIVDGNPDAQAFAGWHRGKGVRERGNIEVAVRYEREAAGLFHRLDRPQQVEQCLTYEALALALGGQSDAAAKILRQIEQLDLPDTWYVAIDQIEARAWTGAAFGDLDCALRHLRAGIVVADEIGDRVGEASLLHALARLGHAEEALERLPDTAARIEGDLAPARVSHVQAIAAADGCGLEMVAARFEDMGATLLAAEALADAAVAWRRTGEARRSMAAERRAHALRQRANRAFTPALLGLEVRANLTESERHIALLAANGQSNKEIALHLSRSVRTIENRLQRIYEKLGISSRQNLGQMLKIEYAARGAKKG